MHLIGKRPGRLRRLPVREGCATAMGERPLPAAAVGGIVVVLDILLFLAFVALPVAALCMQTIPMRLTGVTFHDTDLPHAWELVIAYAEGTFEQRFGYPTGYFAV